jgi:ferritin
MISPTMTEALNRQINAELYSAYLYLSMSSYASFNGLRGAANWFWVQAQEEMSHAQKLYDYVNSQGMHALVTAIEGPPTEFNSLRDLFERGLAHEQLVTGLINDLANLAREEKDHATGILLQWFVTEQVEEEENARDILDKLKLADDNGAAMFMLDGELAARVFTPISATE